LRIPVGTSAESPDTAAGRSRASVRPKTVTFVDVETTGFEQGTIDAVREINVP
jgi:uncharacterized protein YprB with RNaseH-like and TPR domain